MAFAALLIAAPLLLGHADGPGPVVARPAAGPVELLLPGDAAWEALWREVAEEDGEEEDGLPCGPRLPLDGAGPTSCLGDLLRSSPPRPGSGGHWSQRAPPAA